MDLSIDIRRVNNTGKEMKDMNIPMKVKSCAEECNIARPASGATAENARLKKKTMRQIYDTGIVRRVEGSDIRRRKGCSPDTRTD